MVTRALNLELLKREIAMMFPNIPEKLSNVYPQKPGQANTTGLPPFTPFGADGCFS
jgi:hypothetical protein